MNLGHINFHRLTDSDLASIWAAIETQPARPEALEMIDAPPRCTMKGLLKRLAQAEPQHEAKAPLVVSCGIGVDSVAMLVGLWRRGIRPDLILFADPGSEWPETYLYVLVLAAWLAEVGFPPLTIVRRDQGRTSYTTLEGNCLVNRTLPSMAFGYGGCSQKWKREPMDKLVGRWYPRCARYELVSRPSARSATTLAPKTAGAATSKTAPATTTFTSCASGAGTATAAKLRSSPPACRCRARAHASSAQR
ncbi:MAG TPA: hypothetical protein PKV97_01850 [Thauera aminoaromatica]|nr:hypothetical protein [Thauera aminoaromatica]